MIAAITTRITYENNYFEIRDSISQDLTSLLKINNIYPVLIPNISINPNDFFKKIPFDFLILSGGGNVDLDNIKKGSRENTEIEFLKFCIDKTIPVIGLCRGMQFINIYFGGTQKVNNNQDHINNFHKITSKQSLKFLPFKSFFVNSFHENIIEKDNLPNNITPLCVADDETIETIIHDDLPILGIMWHPERKFKDKNIENFFSNEFFVRSVNFLKGKF